MTSSTLYRGAFSGIDGTAWEVLIFRAGAADDATPAETAIGFPADTPVEIEWPVTAKLDAVCGSSLTLRVISDTDRRFIGLYSTQPGEVGCTVLRNGEPYWHGWLDTELYSEPYSYGEGYEVSFTFSDLGLLHRKRWDAHRGHMSWGGAVERCLQPLLNCTDPDGNKPGIAHNISTAAIKRVDGLATNLELYSHTLINPERFYDNDGEGFTLYEALEALLKPFALRIEQRGATFHIYDMAGLYEAAPEAPVVWDGTDAELGVDKVYNNVSVTFKPQVSTDLLDCTISHDEVAFEGTTEVKEIKLYPDETESGISPVVVLPGFTYESGKIAKLPDSIAEIRSPAKVFRITSAYSGSDCAGVAFGPNGPDYFQPEDYPYMVRTKPIYLPNLHGRELVLDEYGVQTDCHNKLRIALDLLFDPLSNPFERNAESEKKILDNMKEDGRLCFAYVQVRLNLYVDSSRGLCLYHYTNIDQVRATGYAGTRKGRWVLGEDRSARETPDMVLSYYADDRKKDTPLKGWCTNRPPVGGWRKDLPSNWSTRGNGEFIPMPPCDGWLEIIVEPGVLIRDWGHPIDNTHLYYISYADDKHPMRWLLYKDLKLELRGHASQALSDEVTGDVEYSAWLERNAEESAEIETSIGSDDGSLACACGVLLSGDTDRRSIEEFSRGGVTDRAERLLIGTAFSQHAARHTTLSGTTTLAAAPDTAFRTWRDAASPDMLLMRMGSVENLREAEATTTFCELSPENYEAIEYEQ